MLVNKKYERDDIVSFKIVNLNPAQLCLVNKGWALCRVYLQVI